MPLYTTVKTIPTQQQVINTFGGYNHNLKISDGEFYEMRNMSSSLYPILAPRCKRGVFCSPDNPQGMIAKDALCYVDGEDFIVNGYRVNMGLSTLDEYCPKQLVSFGAYVIIMPDKMYINTADITDYGSIEHKMPFVSDGVAPSATFTLCRIDGSAYLDVVSSVTEPSNPENMDMWIDTSDIPHTLKQYSITSRAWISIPTTYVKISAENIGKGFSQYDGVNLSGFSSDALKDFNSTTIIWEKGDNYIVVTGIIDETINYFGEFTICRLMPYMDYIIESNNRLFGCRYGNDINGNHVNEIYASKAGDFKNWNCFMGISTDSYVVSVGSEGDFTGAVNYLGNPCFFKENCVHKLYGDYPYRLQTTDCRGVQNGSSNSLAIVNEILYYKSRNAVCAYDGSLPVEISSALGDTNYGNATAGACRNKYYISMSIDDINTSWLKPFKTEKILFIQQTYGIYQDDNILYLDYFAEPSLSGNRLNITQLWDVVMNVTLLTVDADSEYENDGWVFLVYDTQKGMWHKEDNTHIDSFCYCDGDMYFIEHNSKKIKSVFGTGEKELKATEWMVETGVIGMNVPDKKYISSMNIRMSLGISSYVMIFIEYDSSGEWEYVSTTAGTSLKSFNLPIRPRRCDHFRLKIMGRNEARIYSITKYISEGSELD